MKKEAARGIYLRRNEEKASERNRERKREE